MLMSLKITTLVENEKGENSALYNAHGISFLIEDENDVFLFDTGQHDLFIKNAEELGLDLTRISNVIISHNHWDHTGGLRHLINKYGMQNIIVHETFFKEKFALEGIKLEYLGMNYNETSLLKTGSKLIKVTDDITYLNENVFIAGNFKKYNNYETINKRFYIKEKTGEFIVDEFKDEIAVGIKTNKGLVILLGCAHPGVINMIKHIICKTGIEDIYCVLGGTHLVEADDFRINKTIKVIKDMNIKYVGFSHCTGKKAISMFINELPNKFFTNNTGTSIEV
jgi:7,8-dihydropterin-6-yl-methyl-4-(beta-D-ribofuranosyl)aminobenzene 5'-phosphate synthase